MTKNYIPLTTKPSPMIVIPLRIKWEYKLITEFLDENDLNKLGDKSWELITRKLILHDNGVVEREYIFKRPVAEKGIENEESLPTLGTNDRGYDFVGNII